MGLSRIMNGFPLITVLTATPLVGAVLLLRAKAGNERLARQMALAFSLVGLFWAVLLWANFDPSATGLQFAEHHAWIPTLGAEYFVGVDGLGLLMVMLTAIVTPIAILASWRIEDKASVYHSLVLFLQAGLFGTFTALNFFHWFIFWELSLVPAFFLIKLWGGPKRSAAATQFFIYTMVGSVAMLLSFLAIYWAEALGGPSDYTESMGNESSVVRMHSGNGEHQEMDERAQICFAQALDDAGLPDDPRLRSILKAYFRWATRDRPFRHLDAWIRRRLRCVRLKQRKRSYSIAKFLESLGVPTRQAWLLARSGKGWWRKSGSPQSSEAMTKQWFRDQGLVGLTDRIAALNH